MAALDAPLLGAGGLAPLTRRWKVVGSVLFALAAGVMFWTDRSKAHYGDPMAEATAASLIQGVMLGKPDTSRFRGSSLRPLSPTRAAFLPRGAASPWNAPSWAATFARPEEGAMDGRGVWLRAGENKFGDMAKNFFDKAKDAADKAKDAASKVGKQVTGDESYELGDATKAAAKAAAAKAAEGGEKMKKAANAAGKVITDDENYEVGDITKGVVDKAKNVADAAGKAIKDVADAVDEPPA
jgi:hypothetical protein